jgi:DNA-binding NarL/FixJ family response regulator
MAYDMSAEKQMVLTDRQKNILSLMAKGLKNEAIAVQMGISVNTIKYHKKVIFEQLGAISASQAVAIALSLNIIHI